MKAFSSRIPTATAAILTAALLVFVSFSSVWAQSQVSSADLSGTVVDPNGAAVPGASVTAKNSATGLTRTVTADDSGVYKFIGLPPSDYEISAEASSFKKTVVSPVKLTVGQNAELQVKLEVGTPDVIVTVSGDSVELIETSKTSVSNTIDQQRIENLPINERSATGFALTLSTVGRDNGRPIGPAPTSGLNIGGQRGRSTQVNVDGADFTDNSINASRSTLSQEAVQEYQVSTNSYMAEFGRATGGIVNVVTKRGTNDWRGNIFGFLRDKSTQARAPFAPFKSAFTRTQYGATLGGPISKDRAFFFLSWERRLRNETGFFTSDVAKGLTASVTLGAPILPFTQTFNRLTPQQAAFANGLISSGVPANISAAVNYLYLASSGGNTALLGTNPLISAGGAIPAGTVVGQRFFLTGTPIPVNTRNVNGDFIAFRPLNNLARVFPIHDGTQYTSLRFDVALNNENQLSVRGGFNPSTLTGIQVESQNQSLGQNDFSRTGITEIKDSSFTMALNSILGSRSSNELRFQFGRRDTTFKSQVGDAVAYNISGTAFIGRELFSPVDRTETRYQFVENFTHVWGAHTLKFGGDVSTISIPSALFELNFAGLFNFGDFAASNLGFPASAPAFTPVQAYGLGLPSIYIQGFGNPISQIRNKPIAFFAQDSWKATSRLTFNFGIRYDVELTDTIQPVGFRDPLSNIQLSSSDLLAAQDALGVQQGIPRDTNNWAPRFGFAFDLFGNGKTVIRGAFGLYYDHPLLAVAFNSDIADAAQQQQAVLTAGSPSPTALFNAAQVFHGTVCGVQGSVPTICGPVITPGVAASAQYQFGRQRFNDQTFTGFGAVLPFTLPVSKDFKYASAVQANLSFERQVTKNMVLTVSYIHVGAHNLPHPTDLNSPRTDLQIQNFMRFAGRLPGNQQEAVAFSIPSAPTPTVPFFACPMAPTLTCYNNPTPGPNQGTPFIVIVPGMITAPLTNPTSRIIAPAVANFFRPNAPNYFLAQALSGGAVTPAVLNSLLPGTLRTPGVVSPFGAVNAQVSDGNSSYDAMNVELKRRFANNFMFLASYTWSHSIDDSSDLQTLLIAQDPRNFRAERADSLFDQRHRFVFSAVWASPTSWRSSDSGAKKFFSDFTIAPIIELSSGRPFNIITNVDANNDQSSQTDRPNVLPDGTLCVPGETINGVVCGSIFSTVNGVTVFSTGNLGRNRGITHPFMTFDLRVARSIRFGERFRIELIAEGFNLFNRFNEGSASPNYRDINAFGKRDSGGRFFSTPTASYDQRQLQFGAKFHF